MSYEWFLSNLHTADFIKKILGGYTRSMEPIYLSGPEGTGSCGYLFHEIPGMFMNRTYLMRSIRNNKTE